MSTEKPPLPMLERSQNLLREGQSLAVNTDLKAIGVEFWIIKFRSLLTQLYGEKAPQLDHCPPPSRNDPKLSKQERIRQRLPFLKNLVQGLGSATPGKKFFIGHGRSPEWLRLRSFLTDRLLLDCDEFNIEPTPGIHTTERLETMLSQAGMAFLVMTAEDSHADSTVHARENVVHEVGLFQGRVGSRRAIVMIEDGCAKFSNLDGLTMIYFPRNDISARFEEVRRVIEREGFA